MNATAVLTLVIGLVTGGITAALAVWLIYRARFETQAAQAQADDERHRADLVQARAELSDVRADIAAAGEQAAQATARAEAARAETSAVHARLAEAKQAVGTAEAERDAAIQRANDLAADRESLITQFKVLSAETIERQGKAVDESADRRLQATEQLLTPVRASLDAFNNRLTEVEKQRVAMATDLRNQVANVQLTGEALRKETQSLATALRKPQVRGAWGEMQLKRVVELAGMVEHCDFTQQATATTSDGQIRPDLKVNLADGKFVYVDSKMPLTAFLDAQETDDPTEQEHRMRLFAKNVRGHIDALSSKKYWQADSGTPEFVVLFMPSEALAAEALQLMPDLHEHAALKDVVLATPTTLIATLRTVAYGWKQVRIAENAAEVAQLGQELYERLGNMGKHFDKLGRSLQTSVKAYNEAVGSMESRVLVSARRFRDLKVTTAELEVTTGLSDAVRPIAATELVADATEVEVLIGREPAPDRQADSRDAGTREQSQRDAGGHEQLPERELLTRQPPEIDDLAPEPAATPLPLRQIG